MSQSNDVRKQIEEILHSHANWSHRWDKDNPTTYIYGGDVMDTVAAKRKLLDLLEQSNWEARDNAIRLVLDNYDEWMKPENRQYGTVLENFIKRVAELQHPEGRE